MADIALGDLDVLDLRGVSGVAFGTTCSDTQPNRCMFRNAAAMKKKN